MVGGIRLDDDNGWEDDIHWTSSTRIDTERGPSTKKKRKYLQHTHMKRHSADGVYESWRKPVAVGAIEPSHDVYYAQALPFSPWRTIKHCVVDYYKKKGRSLINVELVSASSCVFSISSSF